MEILLPMSIYLNIILLCCYQRVHIFLNWAQVHTGVNLVHLKVAHLDPQGTYFEIDMIEIYMKYLFQDH